VRASLKGDLMVMIGRKEEIGKMKGEIDANDLIEGIYPQSHPERLATLSHILPHYRPTPPYP
jgi:hypothetical protein